VQWARDTGMSEVRAKTLVRVWRQWRSATLADRPSFGEAYDRMNNPSRYSEDATGTPWHERVKQGARGLPVEQKAEVARQLLADERVAYHTMRQPETRLAAGRAIVQAGKPTPSLTSDEQTTPPPALSPLGGSPASLDVLLEVSKIEETIRRVARYVQANVEHLTDEHRSAILDETRRARVGLDWIDSVVSGGGISDAALEAFLAGGGQT
jgi:Family of unknown function (DUF6192)